MALEVILGALLIIYTLAQDRCTVNNIHLQALQEKEWMLPQSGVGGHSTYYWIVGWCKPIKGSHATVDRCDKKGEASGFVQQFNDKKCITNFNIWDDIQSNGTGVNIRVKAPAKTGHKQKVMHIYIACHKATAGVEVHHTQNSVNVVSDADTYHYYFNLRSRCACPNEEGCDLSAKPPPVITPAQNESAHSCKMLTVDLSSLPPKQFVVPQHWIGHRNKDEYQWVIGFCNKVFDSPTGSDPCRFNGGAGFLQQYAGGECKSDFNIWKGMKYDEDRKAVVITVEDDDEWKYHKIAEITIFCDPHGKPGEVHHSGVMNEVVVRDSPDRKDTLLYYLNMTSKCACSNGCNHSEPLPLHPDTTIPKALIHDCSINAAPKIDINGLKPKQYIAKQHLENKHEVDSEYIWLVGWCSPVTTPVLGNDPCNFNGGFGYLQQYQQGKCKADFNEWEGITPITDGIQITVVSRQSHHHVKRARIQIVCDDKANDRNAVHHTHQVVKVEEIGKTLEYTLTFKSGMACPVDTRPSPTPLPNPNHPPSPPLPPPSVLTPTPIPVPLPHPAPRVCKIGDIDFRTVGQKDFISTQTWTNNPSHQNNKEYQWQVGWCTPVKDHPTDKTPCTSVSGDGFAQQFGKNRCTANFIQFGEFKKNNGGVEFTYSSNLDHRGRIKRLKIHVDCNKDSNSNHVHHLFDSVPVTSNTKDGQNYLDYEMRFKSRCACPGLCNIEKDCRIGDAYLGSLATHETDLLLEGTTLTHTFVVGWCRRILQGPTTIDPCGQSGLSGYVHMYSAGKCEASFDKDFDMYQSPEGIVMTAQTQAKIIRLVTRCDKRLAPNEVHHEHNKVSLQVVDHKMIFTIYYRSRCACAGGCVPDHTITPIPLPPLPVPPPKDMCRVGDIQISQLAPAEVTMSVDGQMYVWTIGFCKTVFDGPTGISPCSQESGAGYVQQSNELTCFANFKTPKDIRKTDVGLQLVFQDGNNGFVLQLNCDPTMTGNKVVQDSDKMLHRVVGNRHEYELSFRTKCACPGGCGAGSSPRENTDLVSPGTLPPRHAHSCILKTDSGTIDLSNMAPKQYSLQQSYKGQITDYEWVVGWCNSIVVAPTGYSPCSEQQGWGYLQQFRMGKCKQDLRKFVSVNANGVGDQTVVEITLRGEGKGHHKYIESLIKIRCDSNSRHLNYAHHVGNYINVTEKSSDTLYYELNFRSACACPGRCGGSAQTSPVAPSSVVPTKINAPKNCKVGSRDLSSLKPLELVALQRYLNNSKMDLSYLWVIGWCSPITVPPSESQAGAVCTSVDGPGFVQQFRDGKCHADFNNNFNLEEDSKNNRVVIRSTYTRGVHHVKNAYVYVQCDKSVPMGVVVSDSENITVILNKDNQQDYYLYFRSRCACKGGCVAGSGCGFLCKIVIFPLIIIVAYLSIGVIYNKMTKPEATSLSELLPHTSFWKALPTIIVFGCGRIIDTIGGRIGGGYSRVAVVEMDDDLELDDENDNQYL